MRTRLVAMLVLGVALFGGAATAQDLGVWEIIYASDDEMLLLLPAAEFRTQFRPLIHLHCRVGEEPRVFFRPYVEDVRVQFDDAPLSIERFGDISYGFAIDSQGRLVEEEPETERRPMRAFVNSGQIVADMLGHERMNIRFQLVTALEVQAAGFERNYFVLPGLGTILRELGNPCLPDWDGP